MRGRSSFLVADNCTDERMIILTGEKGRENLRHQRGFTMDRTFESFSRQFSQNYTIHPDIGCNHKEIHVFPIFTGLLPSRKKEKYVRLFRLIVQIVLKWKPQKVNVYFQTAVIPAIREDFPFTEINECLFHMKSTSGGRCKILDLPTTTGRTRKCDYISTCVQRWRS